MPFASLAEWLIGLVLILSSLGVILLKKPVHASLSFLLTLMTLATLYLQLSAQFIAVMQIIVYAGAILVIFMFVIILFQDAYVQIENYSSKSNPYLLGIAGLSLIGGIAYFAKEMFDLAPQTGTLKEDYGTVQALGQALYIDFFFPFEAVILLFLIALVGALYIGRKVVP